MAFRDHLNDTSTYSFLSEEQKQMHINCIKHLIQTFLDNQGNFLGPEEYQYIKHTLKTNKTLLPILYLTLKAHKTLLKSRPVVLCCGSFLHSLGIWVDSQLQCLATVPQSFIKSSFELTKLLLQLKVPPTANFSLLTQCPCT